MRRMIWPTEARENVEVSYDAVNEMVVIATVCRNPEARKKLVKTIQPDHFYTDEHRILWHALQELTRRNLDFSIATLQSLASNVDTKLLGQVLEDQKDPANLDYHVDRLMWDHARSVAIEGPLSSLISSLRDSNTTPDIVKGHAKQLTNAFNGYENRSYLYSTEELVRIQMDEIRKRISGHAFYPYGIDGLDMFEAPLDGTARRRRMVPGCAPGCITAITGVSGCGKSTVTAHLALGLARQKKRIAFGSWEMKAPITLELLACISLGWSRTKLMAGEYNTEEDLSKIQTQMTAIGKYVKFIGTPFRRNTGEKMSNDRNLDTIQGYLSDISCDVFIADLWERALHSKSPEDIQNGLERQQAMAEELKIHCILIQQQRLKDVEARQDNRPTREGIKGSAAWVEVPDTIIGIHRPSYWVNDLPDDKLEMYVLKQRYGEYPLAVEFDWNPEFGQIKNGKSLIYRRKLDDANEFSDTRIRGGFRGQSTGGPKGRPRRKMVENDSREDEAAE